MRTIIFGCLGKWCAWLVLLLTISAQVQAKTDCQTYKFKYTYGGEDIWEEAKYCIDFKEGSLANPECRDLNCLEAIQADYKKLLQGKKQNIGTTGFHLCHQLGAIPQIIKVKGPHGLQTLDRCRLEDVGTVDTVSLHYYLREKRQ